MDSGLESITEDELINLIIDGRLLDLHVSMPARVEAYHAATQTVDVVPMLRRAIPDGDGNYVTEALPKLADVPVCFPRVGGMFISLPIAAGDFVWLIFGERNIGTWRATGSDSDPGDLGMHTLDGAMAIPGVFPDQKALANADATNMVLGSDTDGNSRIELKPTGGVNLGAGASKGVARNGDHADVGTMVFTFVPGPAATLSVTYTDPDGNPTVLPAGSGTVPLKAKINESSTKIKAVD